jgi:hypothetical protein
MVKKRLFAQQTNQKRAIPMPEKSKNCLLSGLPMQTKAGTASPAK